MGTFVVGAILVGVVAFVIRSIIRDKKNGKSIQCGGDCRPLWRTLSLKINGVGAQGRFSPCTLTLSSVQRSA